MSLLLTIHPTLRRIYNYFRPLSTGPKKQNGTSGSYISAAEGEARMRQRLSFDSVFVVVFLFALHGFSAFKVFFILYLNYNIATRLPRRYVPAATWIFNICTLFANELSDGYKYEKIAAFLSGPENGITSRNWGTWLDDHSGIIPRWEIPFNISVLRLISFNLDYYWSLDTTSSPLEVHIPIFLEIHLGKFQATN